VMSSDPMQVLSNGSMTWYPHTVPGLRQCGAWVRSDVSFEMVITTVIAITRDLHALVIYQP
jgi:hypothetical protein